MVVSLLALLSGCATTGKDRLARACPTVQAPVLQAGDAWHWQDEKGAKWTRRYIRQTEDGLFLMDSGPNQPHRFFDNTHTLRKVYRDGIWITRANADFPDLGQLVLIFPLQIGSSWSAQVLAPSTFGMLLNWSQTFTVVGCEQVTVPAGTFLALVIEEDQRVLGDPTRGNCVRTWWYAPEVKFFVKLTHGRASHPGYWSGSRDWALTSYQLAGGPASRPQGRLALQAGSPRETSVPIEVAGKIILVPVEINGFPPMPFILDTGASVTVLQPATAQRMGVAIPPKAPTVDLMVVGGRTVSIPLARVKTVKVGQIVVEDMDLGIFESHPDIPELAGLLGGDFLDHFNVSVDRQARRLTLSVSADPGNSAITNTTSPPTFSCPKGAVWTGKGCIAEELMR